ncbi:MAG: hypothetical protein GSR80_001386 [Desulfurococcales archaeon]|nr:hypothetical protein [Desulfurococcales archaeon]
MRDQTPYLVYLDFIVTIIGAFAIYSTNFIAYTNAVPIFGTIYGIVVVTRGFAPLVLHSERLFKALPFAHLLFLFLSVTLALLLDDIKIYLAGISVSALLGIYTGGYIYNLEVSWAKRLRDPSRFFSLVSGAEAAAFFIAPLLTYVTPNKAVFLAVLSASTALGLAFLLYFARFGGAELKPRFYTGEPALLRRAAPLAALAALNWLLQYLWMGMVFELGARQGIPGLTVFAAVELETATYMAIQFVISRRGLKKLTSVKTASTLMAAYALVVALFTSLLCTRVSPAVFTAILLALAVSSSPLEPLINTLVSLTDRAPEVSTVILSFNYIGGGIGYTLSSLLLRT